MKRSNRRPIKLEWVLCVSLLLFNGCREGDDNSRIKALEEKVRLHDEKLAALTTELKALTKLQETHSSVMTNLEDRMIIWGDRIGTLRNEVSVLWDEVINPDRVEVDPFSKAFLPLRTRFGTLLVLCDGAEPYLNGHKIKLRIGNPLNSEFAGFQIECEFGLKHPMSPGNDYKQYLASLRTNVISFPQSLKSGSWNEAELILAPTTPEQLGHIKISLDLKNVALKAARPN